MIIKIIDDKINDDNNFYCISIIVKLKKKYSSYKRY